MNANLIPLRAGGRRHNALKTPKMRFGVATILVVVADEPRRNELIQLLQKSKSGTEGLRFLGAATFEEARVVLLGPHIIYAVLLESSITSKQIVELEKIQPHIRIAYWKLDQELWPKVSEVMDLKEIVDRFVAPRVVDTALLASRDIPLPVRVVREVDPEHVLGLVGDSPAMQRYLARLQDVALVQSPVLIEGETGSGKSEGARWIHRYRQMHLKKKGPLIEVNMAAIPDSVAESQLFGHEKGAFTGADQRQIGQFEAAQDGTLFLDEIGDCPLSLQKKLLKVIDEKTLTRIGSQKPIRYQAKLICATNRNLKEMVQAETFRKDLYYRISTLHLRCPSLEERKEDIPRLLHEMFPQICEENGLSLTYDDLPKGYIQYLMMSSISGNVRGLKQRLLRFITFAPRDETGTPLLKHWRQNPALELDEEEIHSTASPLTYEQLLRIPLDVFDGSFPGLKPALQAMRERFISSALERYGDVDSAAKALGIPTSTLYGHLRMSKAGKES